MKLTRKQLKRIIKEEIQRVLSEDSDLENYGSELGNKVSDAGLKAIRLGVHRDDLWVKFRQLIKQAYQPFSASTDEPGDWYIGLYRGLSDNKILMGDSEYKKLYLWARKKNVEVGSGVEPWAHGI